jgi:hypothetical protein
LLALGDLLCDAWLERSGSVIDRNFTTVAGFASCFGFCVRRHVVEVANSLKYDL